MKAIIKKVELQDVFILICLGVIFITALSAVCGLLDGTFRVG